MTFLESFVALVTWHPIGVLGLLLMAIDLARDP